MGDRVAHRSGERLVGAAGDSTDSAHVRARDGGAGRRARLQGRSGRERRLLAGRPARGGGGGRRGGGQGYRGGQAASGGCSLAAGPASAVRQARSTNAANGRGRSRCGWCPIPSQTWASGCGKGVRTRRGGGGGAKP